MITKVLTIERDDKLHVLSTIKKKKSNEFAHRVVFWCNGFKFHTSQPISINTAIEIQERYLNCKIDPKNVFVEMDGSYYRVRVIISGLEFHTAKMPLEQVLMTRKELVG